jgi:hypothetical protein
MGRHHLQPFRAAHAAPRGPRHAATRRPRSSGPGRPGQRRGLVAVLSLLLVGSLVWQSASAAFFGSTTKPTNSFTAGTVSITSSAAGSATFTLTGLKPGSTGSSCVLVTYTGNLASSVKLYGGNYVNTDAVAGAGHLAANVTLTVDQGSGTTCGAFGTSTNILNETVAAFGTNRTAFGSGVGSWTPSTNGTAKPYLITYLVGNDNAAQGDLARVDLIWEAQST